MAENNDALMLRLASHVSLFTGMPRTALVLLLARAERVTKAPEGLFFDEGEMGASFYVLVMGRGVVEKRSGRHWVDQCARQKDSAISKQQGSTRAQWLSNVRSALGDDGLQSHEVALL